MTHPLEIFPHPLVSFSPRGTSVMKGHWHQGTECQLGKLINSHINCVMKHIFELPPKKVVLNEVAMNSYALSGIILHVI